MIPSSPPGIVTPLRREDRLRLELQQRARTLEADFLTFAGLAREVIDGGWWARWGFASPEAWATEDLGLSYRSLRRRLAVLEAVDTLPAGEQAPAMASMAEIGGTKAAILAPVLRSVPQAWRELVQDAREESVAAVQARADEALARQPRTPAEDRSRSRFLALLPPDEREAWAPLWDVLATAAGGPGGVWTLVRAAVETELAARGVTW